MSAERRFFSLHCDIRCLIGSCGAGILQSRTLALGRSSHVLAEREVEFAACTEFAVHPDASAHFPHQSGTNGETQSHAAVNSHCSAVALRKNVEDRSLFLGLYSDSCVRHGAMQQNAIPHRHFYIRFHRHLAPLGKLDGIVNHATRNLSK